MLAFAEGGDQRWMIIISTESYGINYLKTSDKETYLPMKA
jgi:hypothetical protein